MTTETRLELAAKLGAKEAKRALDTRCPYPRDDPRRGWYIDGFMRAVATYDEPAREEPAPPAEPDVEPEADTAPPVDGEDAAADDAEQPVDDGERVDEELADAPGGDVEPPADAPEDVDDEPAREEPAS